VGRQQASTQGSLQVSLNLPGAARPTRITGQQMRIERIDPAAAKGWLAGSWDSNLAVSVGYATTGVDEPHLHSELTEVYLVARGASRLRVEQATLNLTAGDAVIIEPGEAHTFLWSSPEYLHFVIHVPGLAGQRANSEKVAVLRNRLGL
jgi:mannose-6-phosphate isomerase-like protein (cupin superfamily)